MTDRELEDVVLFLSGRVRALEARLAVAAPTTGDPAPFYELASVAFTRLKLPFNEQQRRKICQRHRWAQKLTGKVPQIGDPTSDEVTNNPWYVLQPDFNIFAERVAQGLELF